MTTLSRNQTLILAASVIGFGALAVSPALAAVDMYLKIGDIKGESQASGDGHKDWINLDSVSWISVAQPHNVAPPSGTASRMATARSARSTSTSSAVPPPDGGPGELTIMRSMDKASPKLSQACNSGKAVDKVEIATLNAAERGKREPYLTYELHDVMITCAPSGGSGDRPMEEVTLNYQKIIVHKAEAMRPARMTPKPKIQGRH